MKVLDIPASVSWLGKNWLEGFGFGFPKKTYFRGKTPPKLEIVGDAGYTMLPLWGEVYVPKKSLKKYQNWYKSSGEYEDIDKDDWKTF